jgi:hypothetical protein
MKPKKEQEVYSGWLVSTNLWKRCLAVWGHLLGAYLLFVLLGFVIGLVIFMFDFIFS